MSSTMRFRSGRRRASPPPLRSPWARAAYRAAPRRSTQHPVGGRLRGHRAEQRRLSAQPGHVLDAVPAVAQHQRQVAHHAIGVMAPAALANLGHLRQSGSETDPIRKLCSSATRRGRSPRHREDAGFAHDAAFADDTPPGGGGRRCRRSRPRGRGLSPPVGNFGLTAQGSPLAVQGVAPGRRDGNQAGRAARGLPASWAASHRTSATRLRRCGRPRLKSSLEALDAMRSQLSARVPLAPRELTYATSIVLVAHPRTLWASARETGPLTSRQGGPA
jgi:hypothetical protein